MISLTQYQALKTAADKARDDASKAEGAYQAGLKQLEERFDCKTPEQAKTKLAKLKADLDEAEATFNAQLEKYDAKWKAAIAKAS